MNRPIVRVTMIAVCWMSSGLSAVGQDKPAESTEQPEDVFRRFLLSVFKADIEAVCRDALPCPGMSVLWAGESVPEEAIAEIERHLSGVQFRRLQPGDTVTLGNGKTIRLTADNLGADRVSLTDDEMPTPTFLERVDGRWQVDARSFVAARQAAKLQSVVGVPRDEQKRWRRKEPSKSPVTPALLHGVKFQHSSRIAAPEQLPAEKPGSTTWIARTEKRADASSGMMLITHMPDPSDATLEQILKDMLGTLNQHYDYLDATQVEGGTIQNYEFRRFLWSGIKKQKRTKVLGFAYLTKVGADLWFFLGYDQTPEFRETLPLFEDVVLSFEVAPPG